MPAAITARLVKTPPHTKPITTGLVVADAGWFTTENLFSAVERESVATLLLKCWDYRNALNRGLPPWRWHRRIEPRGPRTWQREMILPTGWMNSYPKLGMRPIARAIEAWRSRLPTIERLVLAITYPQYLALRDLIQPDQSVYFNVDDYTLYWPRHAERMRVQERRAVEACDLTVCVSKLRCDELRAAMPARADDIQHLPHGCPEWAIDDRPHERPAAAPLDLSVIPGPRLGYVGTLGDRVDWDLLASLAERLPQASLVLIGRPGENGNAPWQERRRRCLSLPNVRLLGWKSQSEIAAYNRAFDVNLIPYRFDHPFNQQCNPTKIMDYMGSGRPIVATALPECRLHAERFAVAETSDEFVDHVRSILDAGSCDGKAALRHRHAVENSCSRVAERLLDWIG